MKSLKKILSIFAAFMMVVGLTAANVKANEATQTGDITISNAVVGQTYTLYKLFDASYSSKIDENGKKTETVAYLATQDQVDWFNANASNLFTFTATQQPIPNTNPVKYYSNVEAKTGIGSAQIVAALKAASEKEDADSITTIMTKVGEPKTATKAETDPDDTKTVELKFENVPYGYYYIESTLGALVTIDSNTPEAIVNDKNATKFDKKVENLDVTSAEIGKTVNFTIDVEVFPGSGSFKVTDIMSKGLTPHDDVDVKVNGTTIGKANFSAQQTTNSVTKETTTIITLTDAYLNGITAKTELTITYTATVNEEALTLKTNEGNDQDFVTNSASLEYGNTNSSDSTKIYLGQFPLEKVDESKKQLSGAKFELYYAGMENGNLVVSNKKVNLIKNGENYYATTKDVGAQGTTTEIEVGKTTIQGLEVGVYALKEIKAPDGYNLAKDPIKVEITKTVSETNNKTWTMGSTPQNVQVENSTGTELPSTGGMGTTMIYIAGAILMVGAAIIFVTNKRMKHE